MAFKEFFDQMTDDLFRKRTGRRVWRYAQLDLFLEGFNDWFITPYGWGLFRSRPRQMIVKGDRIIISGYRQPLSWKDRPSREMEDYGIFAVTAVLDPLKVPSGWTAVKLQEVHDLWEVLPGEDGYDGYMRRKQEEKERTRWRVAKR